MNCITKFHEMRPYQQQIADLGYTVHMMQDGTLHVQDVAIIVNGHGRREERETIELHSAAQAERFISDNS